VRGHRSYQRRGEHGQGWEVAASLWGGPLTGEEIVEHFRSYLRFMGFFAISERLQRSGGERRDDLRLDETLASLQERDWVAFDGERYALTERGREEAAKPLADMQRARRLLASAMQPATVSRITLYVHLALAAVKLPAGLISGSIGLLNDATDTLLDALSSLIVYAGIRAGKERAANAVLVVLMLGMGGYTFFEALRRLLVPTQPEVEAFAFVAAIVSALVCGALWAYQRFVGWRKGSVALITQSVDSRNHVIVAGGVTAGLIAALLRFPLLDTVVGLAVAALILRSAIELAMETIRSFGGDEVDLARYKMSIVERYEEFRKGQLADWMLFLVDQGKVSTVEDLLGHVCESLDFGRNPILQELGISHLHEETASAEETLADLIARGLLEGGDRLALTPAGAARIAAQRRYPKRGHLWPHHVAPALPRPDGRAAVVSGSAPPRARRAKRSGR